MTDIAKCRDGTCPSRDLCWRFTAPEGLIQTYSDFTHDPKTGRCGYFWPEKREYPFVVDYPETD